MPIQEKNLGKYKRPDIYIAMLHLARGVITWKTTGLSG